MKRYIIGIDDTDNYGSKGTGAIAGELKKIISDEGFGKTGFITRHQLLIHPDIKYTSHNSSMIFTADVDESRINELETILEKHLKEESAEGSDPGLCIFCPEDLKDKSELISFGYLAKNVVLTKEDAYRIAQRNNIYLKELGGEGIGIIGALAGVALRYSGNDGELKGGAKDFEEGETYLIKDFLAHKNIDSVQDIDGDMPNENDEVYVPWKVKPILTKDKLVVFVKKNPKGGYIALAKQENRDLEEKRQDITACDEFERDVDEELISSKNNTCANCMYRRWTDKAFTCVKDRK